MSNYVKAVDYSAKDALATGNPNKIIKGTELNDEFNAIATAISSKADLASPAFLGNPTATTQSFGNDSTRLATTAFVQDALQALHPVGSIYISVVATNPNTLFGFGTWVAFATGRTLVGIDISNSIMDTVEETFGNADAVNVSHSHTITDPGHNHTVTTNAGSFQQNEGGDAGGGFQGTITSTTNTKTTGITIDSAGVTGTNKNYQPSIAVYIWKRTA